MSSQIIPVEPFDYVVFGGTGDLAERKLLPALYHRQLAGQLSDPTRIIGASRTAYTDAEYRKFAVDALKEHLKPGEFDDEQIKTFCDRLFYVAVDAKSDAGWDKLKDLLDEGKERVRAFYLAVAPAIFGDISEKIRDHKLITKQTRIVVEKPIGRDLASADALNNTIGKVFREEQIFRIDHYLGKETVQNLMALRFANALFEPLWNASHIDHVQITVAETVGVGDRWPYYDEYGALRDMLQNHMLQLLCLVAMEPPSDLDPDSVRNEKVKVLRSLRPVAPGDSVTGQYGAGAIHGGAVPGYDEELGRDSDTETFVAIKAHIDNWRWKGVPFYLRTGKRMPQRKSEVLIQFKPVPHNIFARVGAGRLDANSMIINLQPEENIRVKVMAKQPGLDRDGVKLKEVTMDVSLSHSFEGERRRIAYERLLLDFIEGEQTLFVRRDEVEAQWQWIDSILGAWAEVDMAPQNYTAGSWGPSSAIALIERDGASWHD